MKRQPVFVGGCGRSGTTMLGSILGAHSSAICIPESLFKRDLLALWAKSPDASHQEVRKTLRQSPTGNIARFEDVPRVRGTPERALACYLNWYLEQHERQHRFAPVPNWVDQTPHNIDLANWLLRAYPGARFVHIVRDGRAVAASLKSVNWGPKTVHFSANEWVARVGSGLAAEGYLGDRIIRVRYEDLVRRPEQIVRTLCDFLGWAFEHEMIKGQEVVVAEAYKAQHLLVGQRPDKQRIESWRKTLKAREIEVFESRGGAMLCFLGYERCYPLDARPTGGAATVLAMVQEIGLRKWHLVKLTWTRLKSRWHLWRRDHN